MKYLFRLLILVNFSFNLSANLFLQKPQMLSPQDLALIEIQAKQIDLYFTWHFSKLHAITYFATKEKPGFVLWIAGLPAYSYNFISLATCKAGYVNLKEKTKNFFSKTTQAKPSYYFTKPIKLTSQNPIKINLDSLVKLLESKSFIFYTGAGLSASANIPTMPALEKSLKIDRTNFKDWLKAAINYPQKLANNFADFHNLALNAQATPAHYALAQIAQSQNCTILTENIDLLQHKTGSAPLFIRNSEIYLAKKQDYQAIDYLICVGLSHDDCGFIAHYKNQNPNGKIIALDLNTPDYLSDNDYLVQADLQTVLPDLAKTYN